MLFYHPSNEWSKKYSYIGVKHFNSFQIDKEEFPLRPKNNNDKRPIYQYEF